MHLFAAKDGHATRKNCQATIPGKSAVGQMIIWAANAAIVGMTSAVRPSLDRREVGPAAAGYGA